MDAKTFVDRFVIGTGWSQWEWWGPESCQDELGLFLQVVDDVGDEMDLSGHVSNEQIFEMFKHLLMDESVRFSVNVDFVRGKIVDVDMDADAADVLLQMTLLGEEMFS